VSAPRTLSGKGVGLQFFWNLVAIPITFSVVSRIGAPIALAYAYIGAVIVAVIITYVASQ